MGHRATSEKDVPRQKRGLVQLGSSSTSSSRLNLPGCPLLPQICFRLLGEEQRAPRSCSQVPEQSPASPRWRAGLTKAAVSPSPAVQPAISPLRRKRESYAGGETLDLLDQAEGRCSHHQQPAVSGRCFVHPVSSCYETPSNSR